MRIAIAGSLVGQPILAAAGFQLARGSENSRTVRKSRLKGGCGQDGPPHKSLWLILAFAFCALASAEVVDRIAVVAGNDVITESEVLQELRLAELENRQPLDLGPAARRSAAERLVDQSFIRTEMEAGGYAQPTTGEAGAMLRQFREQHYPSTDQFGAALTTYGVTEGQLEQHLRWELAVMRFTDSRFRPMVTDSPSSTATGGGAERTGTPAEQQSVERQLDAWIKEQRGNTRIEFKQEAFQ